MNWITASRCRLYPTRIAVNSSNAHSPQTHLKHFASDASDQPVPGIYRLLKQM